MRQRTRMDTRTAMAQLRGLMPVVKMLKGADEQHGRKNMWRAEPKAGSIPYRNECTRGS